MLAINKIFKLPLFIKIILFLIYLLSVNSFAKQFTAESQDRKIKLCIFILVNPELEKHLSIVRDDIWHSDYKKPLVKNIYHISLRHIEYAFTQNQIKDMIAEVKQIAGKNHSFLYHADQKMYIDEDLDIGLNLLMEPLYTQLKNDVLNISIPGKSKTYEPHTTIYYGIEQKNSDHILSYLNSHPFDSTLTYSASKIGLGILGPRNNLVKTLALFDLLPE